MSKGMWNRRRYTRSSEASHASSQMWSQSKKTKQHSLTANLWSQATAEEGVLVWTPLTVMTPPKATAEKGVHIDPINCNDSTKSYCWKRWVHINPINCNDSTKSCCWGWSNHVDGCMSWTKSYCWERSVHVERLNGLRKKAFTWTPQL